MVAFVVWLLPRLVRRESWAPVLSAKLLTPALAFLLFALSSIFWAQNRLLAFRGVLTLVQLLVLNLMVIGLLVSWQSMEWLVRSLVLGGLMASVLTISQFLGFDFLVGSSKASSIGAMAILRSGEGVSGNVNQTGTALAVLLPFAYCLLRASVSRVWRLVGLMSSTLMPIAISITYSRAAYILLILVLGWQLWAMLKRDWSDRWRVVLLIGLVAAVALIVAVPWENMLARMATLAPSNMFFGVENEPTAVSTGRMYIWLVAILMAKDHPLLGVGYGGFPEEFHSYQFLVPDLSYPTQPSAHSSMFDILASLGLIGITLWTWLQVVALRNLSQNRPRIQGMCSPQQRIMAQATLQSLLAYILFGFVGSNHNDKLFWLLLGLSEAVRCLTRDVKPLDVSE